MIRHFPNVWILRSKMLEESWDIRSNFGILSVGGCGGQPILLFWKYMYKSQMFRPHECATTFFKNLRSILVGHFGLQSVSYRVETPCTIVASYLKRILKKSKSIPSIAKKIVIAIMQKIWTPDPIIEANKRLLFGVLNTSPWTSFHPVSSILSSRSSSVLYLAISLKIERDKLLLLLLFGFH